MSPTSDDGHTGRSPRKGARVGPVSELSVFLKVKPGREQVIREVFNMPPAQKAELEKAFAASYVLDAWDKFLRYCEGYPEEGKDKAGLSVDEIKEFLTANQVTASDFSMTYRGLRCRRSRRRCAFRRRSSRCWTTPTPARHSSNRR